jgi:hypothetical protein
LAGPPAPFIGVIANPPAPNYAAMAATNAAALYTPEVKDAVAGIFASALTTSLYNSTFQPLLFIITFSIKSSQCHRKSTLKTTYQALKWASLLKPRTLTACRICRWALAW